MFLVPSAVIIGLAGMIVLSGGYGLYSTKTYRDAIAAAWAAARPANRYKYVCQRDVITPAVLTEKNCVINPEFDTAQRTLLWGDSNAAHYIGVIGESAKFQGFGFRNAAASACPPIFYNTDAQTRCVISSKTIEDSLDQFDTILIGAHWMQYATNNEDFFKQFEKTLDRIGNKKVVLLGQIHHIPRFEHYCEQKAIKLPFINCKKLFSLPRRKREDDINNALLATTRDRPNVRLITINDTLCPNGICSAYLKDRMIYYNGGHLSMAGSWFVGSLVSHDISVLPRRSGTSGNSSTAVESRH